MSVNKTWNQVVLTIKADWAKELNWLGMAVSPHANPSPRVCAKLLRLGIDDKFLAPSATPIICELDSSDKETYLAVLRRNVLVCFGCVGVGGGRGGWVGEDHFLFV